MVAEPVYRCEEDGDLVSRVSHVQNDELALETTHGHREIVYLDFIGPVTGIKSEKKMYSDGD